MRAQQFCESDENASPFTALNAWNINYHENVVEYLINVHTYFAEGIRGKVLKNIAPRMLDLL